MMAEMEQRVDYESARSRPDWESWSMRLAIGLAAALMLSLLLVPLLALTLRALGDIHLAPQLFEGSVFQAMRLSFLSTGVSMVIIILLGTPLAFAFARYDFPLKRVLNVLVELPIVLPPVVAGLALLMAFGRRGLLGETLAVFGISLPFTPAAIILAQVFVASPFYIRAVQNRFASIPAEIEDAAGIDGAGPWRIFHSITLPLSRQAMLTGLVLSWARALGEFGATILFAGNLQGRTQTMPLLVYGALERDLNAALWTGVLLIAIAGVTLASVHGLARFLAGHEETDPLSQAY
jgi:molybdate transport system permease protein